MSLRMYQPDKKSNIFMYIFVVVAFVVGAVIFVFTRPLTVESACSEVSLKTSGLTKSFNYDPMSDYENTKAKCLEDVLSEKDNK